MDRELTVRCFCGDTSHISNFMLYDDGELAELYWSVQLNPHPWWKRVVLAFWYVLGKRSRYSYGHWDSGSISKESAMDLVVLLQNFMEKSYAM